MQVHANAKLGLAGLWALVLAVREERSVRAAARRLDVSPLTAKKWSQRWEQASERQRRSLACVADRSSRPRSCPRMVSVVEQERICAERRRTGCHG